MAGVSFVVDHQFGYSNARFLFEALDTLIADPKLADFFSLLGTRTIFVMSDTNPDQADFNEAHIGSDASATYQFYTESPIDGSLSTFSRPRGEEEATIRLGANVVSDGLANSAIAEISTPEGIGLEDFRRIVFHELAHAVNYFTTPSYKAEKVPNYSEPEAIAIAAEDLIYTRDVAGPVRVGHLGRYLDDSNPNHLLPRNLKSYDPTTSFFQSGPVAYADHATYVSFSAMTPDNGVITKSYYRPDTYANYVAITAEKKDIVSRGGVLSKTAGNALDGMLANKRQVVGDFATASQSLASLTTTAGVLTTEGVATYQPSLMTALTSLDLSQFTRMSGLSNERFIDSGIDLVGPASLGRANGSAPELYNQASAPAVLIGASGFYRMGARVRGAKNDDSNSPDHLIGSIDPGAHNFLIAGRGTKNGTENTLQAGNGGDLLIGGEGNDKLIGGSGSDLFIGSLGNDEVVGGAGVDIFVADKMMTHIDTNSASGEVVIGAGDGSKTTVTGVHIFVGGVSKTFFKGNGHSILLAGSGGADFTLKSGDVAIGNSEAKGGNTFRVTTKDVVDGHIGIVGFGKNDKLYVDGKLFNGSRVSAKLGRVYSDLPNADFPSVQNVTISSKSNWADSNHSIDLSDWSSDSPEQKYATYVKSVGGSSLGGGDFNFTTSSVSLFGQVLGGVKSLDLSVTGWQQGFGGISFFEDNLAADLAAGLVKEGALYSHTGILAAGGNNYYVDGFAHRAVGAVFGADSAAWHDSGNTGASAGAEISKLIAAALASGSGMTGNGSNNGSGDGTSGGSGGGSSSSPSLIGGSGSDRLDPQGSYAAVVGGGGGDAITFGLGYGVVTVDEEDAAVNPDNRLALGIGIKPGQVTVSGTDQGDLVLSVNAYDKVVLSGALRSAPGLVRGVQQVSFTDGTIWSYADLLARADTASADNTTLFGDSGANSFDSAGLATSIVGGGGGDTFAYSRGYGALSITEADTDMAAHNVLNFGPGIAAHDVSVSGNAAGDLVLSLEGDDAITLVGELQSSAAVLNGVQVVQFADGTSWNYADLLSRALTPTVAGETIYGDTGANTIDSIGIASTVVGNGGGDTIVYNRGYGALTIKEREAAGAVSTLAFGVGISVSDVVLSVSEDGSLVLSLGGKDVVTLAGELTSDETTSVGVQAISFADGMLWTYQDLLTQMETARATGPSAIYGDGSSNTLDSAGLASTVVGGGGDDTILFNKGYGAVTVDERDSSSQPQNTLQFGAGIDPANVTVSADAAGNFVIDVGGGDAVIVQNALNSTVDQAFGVQQVAFLDGTVWNYDDLLARADTASAANTTLYGDASSNVLDGQGIAHTLVGGGGGDVFVFNAGYGVLTINEQDWIKGGDNVLVLGPGITQDSVSVSATAAGDLVLDMGGGDQITIKAALNGDDEVSTGVEQVQFANGSIWSYGDLLSRADIASANNTSLYGDRYANDFDSKGLAHALIGNGGGDTIAYNVGYGALRVDEQDRGADPTNRLAFGAEIHPSSVSVSATVSGDIVLSLGGGDVVTLVGAALAGAGPARGVQQVTFADGSSWNAEQLRALATGVWAIADNGGAINIDAASMAASEMPTISLGFSVANTTVGFGSGRNSLKLTSANGTSVVIDGILGKGLPENQAIAFLDGTRWTLGQAIAHATSPASSNNYELGSPGADDFNYANGVQEAIGNGGGDTFRYDKGDGDVVLTEIDGNPNPTNKLVFGPGISQSDLAVIGSRLQIASGGSITISDAFQSASSVSYGLQSVSFADGTTLTRLQLLTLADTGTAQNSGTLYGDANDNVIDPAGFSHAVMGVGGNDTIIYNKGYGDLRIEDADFVPYKNDTIAFGPGISASDVVVTPSVDDPEVFGSELDLYVNGSRISIDNEFAGMRPLVGKLTFADGTTLNYQDLLSRLETPVAGQTAIQGDQGPNTLDTKGLVHEAIGGGGGDTFKYGKGYGALDIEEYDAAPNASNRILFASDIMPDDVSVTMTSHGKFVLDLGGADQISFWAPQTGYFNAALTAVQFADGTVWDQDVLLARADTGVAGRESIIASDLLNQTFDSRGYVSYIQGSRTGTDTFLFNHGYGTLTIWDSGGSGPNRNILKFGLDIAPEDVTCSRDGEDLILSAGSSDRVVVKRQLDPSGAGTTFGIQTVAFANGTVWTALQIAGQLPSLRIDAGSVTSGGFVESGSPSTSSATQTVAGSILFSDASSGGTHTAVVSSVTASGQKAGLPDSQALLGLFEVTLATEISGSNPGQASWTFAAQDQIFEYLADGQTVTLTYQVGLSDQEGDAVAQPVVISITGSNHAPVIAGGTSAAVAITEDSGNAVNPPKNCASGVIRFTDPETTDAHSASITDVSVSGTVSGLPGTAAMLGWLSTAPVIEQLAATPASVGWSFAAPNNAFSYLSPGQTATLTYAVQIADGQGGVATQDVVVTITGTGSVGPIILNGSVTLGANAGTRTISPQGGENADAIVFDATVSPADVSLHANGDDLIVTDQKAGISLTVANNFWSYYGRHAHVSTVSFADGTSWSVGNGASTTFTYDGSAGGQALTGSGYGNLNILVGGNGDTLTGANTDIYKFGASAGIETINPAGGENIDVIAFDATVNKADVTLAVAGGDLIVTDQKADIALTVKGNFSEYYGRHSHVSAISFADGTFWSLANNAPVTFTYDGSVGHQTLTGSGWRESSSDFVGGNGDTLIGGTADTYKFGSSAGIETINPASGENADTIQFDATVDKDDLTLQANGDDLIVTDQKAGIALTVKGNFWSYYGRHAHVSTISFSDGTSWSLGNGAVTTFTFDGSAGRQALTGSGYGNTNIFLGGSGDTLSGANTDIYKVSASAGTETINPAGGENVDTIAFDATVNPADVTLQADGDDLVVTDQKAGISLTVKGNFWSYYGRHAHVNTISFADGTGLSVGNGALTKFTYNGSAGNQTVNASGYGEVNTLIGGAGDTLNGVNRDIYLFGASAGRETINPAGGENSDTIVFDATVDKADVTLQANGDDLVITDRKAGIALTARGNFWNYYGQHAHISTLRFADGTSWSVGNALTVAFTYDGSAGGLVLGGSSYGKNGFIGGDGDTLSGMNADTYTFSSTAGHEVINPASGENADTIVFDASVGIADVAIQVSGNDLVLTDQKHGILLNVAGAFWDNYGRHTHVSAITFADGSSVSLSDFAYHYAPTTPSLKTYAYQKAAIQTVSGSANSSGGDAYQLTPNQGGQSGSIWGSVDLSKDVVWSTMMYFGDNDAGADGIGFALARASGSGSYGVLGANSLGIRLDTYVNSGEPNSDFGQIVANENGTTTGSGFTLLPNIEDAAWHRVTINWHAANDTLSYTFDGQSGGAKSFDISTKLLNGATSAAYGFGAATGGASNDQRIQILSVSTQSDQLTVDVGATGGTMVGLLGGLDLNPADTYTYDIVDSNGNGVTDALFEIDNGNELRVRAGVSIGQESPASHDLKVKVTNNGGLSTTADVRIAVRSTQGDLAVLAPTSAGVVSVLGDAVSLGTNGYQLTPDRGGQTGAVWGRVDLSQDVVWSTKMYFGSNDGGADGIGFALASTAGLGAGGLGFGVLGANSLGIKFDTYVNSGEPNSDFAQMVAIKDGSVNGGGFLLLPNIEDAAWHDVTVSWRAADHSLSYTIDGRNGGSKAYDVSANLLNGGTIAAYGFGAATGGASNDQRVQILSVSTQAENLATDVGATGGALVGILGGLSSGSTDTYSYQITDTNHIPQADDLFEIDNGNELRVKAGVTIGQDGQTSHDLKITATDSNHVAHNLDLEIGLRTPGSVISATSSGSTLVGTDGADTFVFGTSFGSTEVDNFAFSGVNHDVLQIGRDVFQDWTHLLGATVQAGTDLSIKVDDMRTITLSASSLSSFKQSDVHFV